ncbi:MAG: hypothetical protein PHE16_02675 [Aliarcobacter sp.]|nr:hypothetical protein [Aliarcobacter sp.]
MRKAILKRIVFVFVLFSMSYYAFHGFSYNFVYDKECNIITEQQSIKIDDKSQFCKNHSTCVSEHELHKPYLIVEKYFVEVNQCKNFYINSQIHFTKTVNNLLKPPTV